MSFEHVRVQEMRDWHAYIGEGASGMARDNGRRENPDIPTKEEEVEAIAEAQWTSIRQG
jgi:hypothetical protein